MSQNEKNSIISLIVSLLVTIPYLFYIVSRYNEGVFTQAEELKFWAIAILVLIPIRIVAEIIVNIIVAIMGAVVTGKEGSSVVDERDKLIELKGTRNSYYIFMLGFITAILAVALGQSVTTMFLVLILTGFIAELCGTFSQLYYYHKGV